MSTPPFPFLPDHNFIIENRYQKADALRAKGGDPYPRRFDPSHTLKAALDAFETLAAATTPVALAGRIVALRSFGKATFFHIQDATGKLQVYLKKDEVDPQSFDTFREHVDTGDYVAVTGTLFRTKTNEQTVLAKSLVLLSKSVRALPSEWYGLTDTDLRYRMRYVDLIVNEQARTTFQLRSRLLSALRRRLDAEGFLEVETPMMQPLYGGASARPFETHHNALDMQLYLRIAPELYLKRLVVGGFERVYEINRNFRNEGISTQHNPEFTMLELYAALWDYNVQMEFVEKLMSGLVEELRGTTDVEFRGHKISMAAPFRRLPMLDAIREITGASFTWSMSEAEVRAEAARHNIGLPGDVHDPATLITEVFGREVEATLIQPTFVMDFPKSLSPLAKSHAARPEVAERFELYIGGIEFANAYSELNDPREQYACFADQVARRKGGDEEAVGEIDTDYVRALEYGMPPTSGLGIGIDRFAMLITNSSSIRDVILFPLMRPEEAGAAVDPAAAEAARKEAKEKEKQG